MINRNTYLQILDEIYLTVTNRRKKSKKNSYTAKLFRQGNKKIAEKVLEESNELIIDFLYGTKKRTIEEVSDLFYHIIVLLNSKGVTPKDVAKELRSRYKKK